MMRRGNFAQGLGDSINDRDMHAIHRDTLDRAMAHHNRGRSQMMASPPSGMKSATPGRYAKVTTLGINRIPLAKAWSKIGCYPDKY